MRRRLTGLLVGLALGSPANVGAQMGEVVVLDARMEASPSTRRGSVNEIDSVDYDVVLSYNLNHGGAPVHLSAVGIDGVALQGILVRLDGLPVDDLEWTQSASGDASPTLWSADIGAQPAGDGRILEVRYTAMRAFHRGRQLTLPLVVPDGVPPEPLPGAFEASIELPSAGGAGMHVIRSFPSDVRGGRGPDNPVVVASLPVLPRLLRFELRTGTGTPWARVSALEAIATLLILVFGALGWRHLQRSA